MTKHMAAISNPAATKIKMPIHSLPTTAMNTNPAAIIKIEAKAIKSALPTANCKKPNKIAYLSFGSAKEANSIKQNRVKDNELPINISANRVSVVEVVGSPKKANAPMPTPAPQALVITPNVVVNEPNTH